MPYEGESFNLMGAVFSSVIKVKNATTGKYYETIGTVLGELVPFKISLGNTASKLSIPIPSSPAIRIRMGFQGPTAQIVAYLHTYERYEGTDGYSQLTMSNFYDTWKNNIEIEDLIKVSTTGDAISPTGYGDAITMDGGDLMSSHLPSSWSVLPHLRPDTYWWVRKRNIIRESGWADKFRLELDLERSWQWSTSGRQRPAWDIDYMACYKDGIDTYLDLTKEYKV